MSIKYYTDSERNELIYYQVPKVLIIGEKYKKMKSVSKMLYIVLIDRVKLSMANGWRDSQGRYYVRMGIIKGCQLLNISNKTLIAAKKELANFNLLEEVQDGLGKSNRLYVGQLDYSEDDIRKVNNAVDDMLISEEVRANEIDESLSNQQKCKNYIDECNTYTDECNNYTSKMYKVHTINNNYNNNNFNKNNLINTSRSQIDIELKNSFPNHPFDQIKERLLNDPTAVTRTDNQYKAMLKIRLEDWKPNQPKNKKVIRTEMVPEWFDEENASEAQIPVEELEAKQAAMNSKLAMFRSN
jgi:hypothetical protein